MLLPGFFSSVPNSWSDLTSKVKSMMFWRSRCVFDWNFRLTSRDVSISFNTLVNSTWYAANRTCILLMSFSILSICSYLRGLITGPLDLNGSSWLLAEAAPTSPKSLSSYWVKSREWVSLCITSRFYSKSLVLILTYSYIWLTFLSKSVVNSLICFSYQLLYIRNAYSYFFCT